MEALSEKEGSKNAIMVRELYAGQKLIYQDQQSLSICVIKSGIAKCFITEDNGKDYILEFLGEGEIVGEIEAIRNQRAICSVEALTPVSIYTMSNVQFMHFVKTMPDFSAVIVELLATRVSNSSIKGARQQLYTLSQILPQLLSALNAQQITFTKQDLSEYMGISVRSLNRLLKEATSSSQG
ncbi:cAMP-binding domain of CRP or a regulatory subunit of cAMP-dependent protein kinases [Chitinophaga sp. CF118]|nr:cAMP-binding domain of CRP or a regulatory subunit of cAMP-dependent protein kinases [Chitinophaga sp. CF118]